METNEFKKIFGAISKESGFDRAFEGWFREFPEVIHVLALQRSNFGKYYYLNIKLFIQGTFGNTYVKSKKLVKIDCGNIFLRQPNEYSNLLDLDLPLEDDERAEGLRQLFREYIIPLSNETTTRNGIIELHKKGDLFILPAVREQLGLC
jgi:hypothetical protein